MGGVSLQSVIVRATASLAAFFNERRAIIKGIPFGDPQGDESFTRLCAELVKSSIDDMDWIELKARTYLLRVANMYLWPDV